MDARMFAQILDLRSQSSQGLRSSFRSANNHSPSGARAVVKPLGSQIIYPKSPPANLTMLQRHQQESIKRLSRNTSGMEEQSSNISTDAGTGGTRPVATQRHPTRSPQSSTPNGPSSPKHVSTPRRIPSPKGSPLVIPRGDSKPVASPKNLVRSSVSSGSFPSLPAVGVEALVATVNLQLACWSQIVEHVDTYGNEDGVRKRAADLHFRELMADMSKHSCRVRQVVEATTSSRSQPRKRGNQLDAEQFYRSECDRLMEEKNDICKRMAAFRAEFEQKVLERAQIIELNDAEMRKKDMDFQAERERLEQEKSFKLECLRVEKESMAKQMSQLQAESQRKFQQEELEMALRIEKLHHESERRIAMERAAANRRLAESREQTEKQVAMERQVTNGIMIVLRELPPLQTAMELGDLALLENELDKWRNETLPERFGECRGVVEAVVKLAQERAVTWRGVERVWRDVMKEVDHLSNNLLTLTQQSQRIFRVLKESQLTKIDLRRSDPAAMERMCEVLTTWQQSAMLHPSEVQALIVRKVVFWPQLGSFDFADLDICLRLVDRKECGVFLSRAKSLVEDEKIAPHELKPLLAHIETMLFFLKYATSEDLELTYEEFRKQANEVEPAVLQLLQWAETEYPPGSELVRVMAGKDLLDGKNITSVLQEVRKPRMFQIKDAMKPFREIFYQWALAMHSRFSLLVLPHHTQAVCLLMFRRFLETQPAPHALIAQVSTGEGKSMIIAAIAIYIVLNLRMKVHVVVDDETLLERDFDNFKNVFDAFEIAASSLRGKGRPLVATLCVSEERFQRRSRDSFVRTRIDSNADIVYCEAKHVQSFYASIARSEHRDFDTYADRILIVDEVDALVIDEEPNDTFVYLNEDLSKLATLMARALAEGAPVEPIAQTSSHPGAGRVLVEMTSEWARGKQMEAGIDFVFLKESGKYCALHAGRANLKSWSLALECRNFQDGLSRDIVFQERLFTASRPRVFKKYRRILGLTGSIGSKPEQMFLKDVYGAMFFTVPPFLKTCRGSPYHDATPVHLGQQQRQVYMEPTRDMQLNRLVEVAFEARERVPVLVIARDRAHADWLVEQLRQAAKSRGLGGISEDMIRSLSRTLYESNPEQFKENLNRATLALGGTEGYGKSWRVTVTDPRGARGTDYRVDDKAVDAQGGLLVIPTIIPTSRREWVQFLGRTARQDCRGQFNCVLCFEDYRALSQRCREALPAVDGVGVIDTVLRWGDRDSAERIMHTAALYNSGLRMNELCEEVFGRKPNVLEDPKARECLVEACQRFRWMSVKDVDEAFKQLPNFDPTKIISEARDMGRPAGGSSSSSSHLAFVGPKSLTRLGPKSANAPKTVMFCLDWSASMMSNDTGTSLSRFEICLASVHRIMKQQVRDHDLVSCVVFGPDVRVIFPPTRKGLGGQMMESRIAGLRPSTAGGTRFFDAVAQCLHLLRTSAPADAIRFLVCLTDGDDLGSQAQNARGEFVTRMLCEGSQKDLNLLVVTVGPLQAINVQIIKSWTERVAQAGGVGKHIPEKDAATIGKAFDVVAECLAEVGGAVEC